MRRVLSARVLAVVLCSVGRAAPGQSGPAAAAQSFYNYHFTHDRGFDVRSLAARRRWIAPHLYSLLKYELQRKEPNGEPPYIDGDPFTDSQDGPDRFTLVGSDRSGGSANVRILFLWLDKGRVIERRKATIRMVDSRGAWRIADIVNHEGTSLARDLTSLRRKDGAGRTTPGTR